MTQIWPQSENPAKTLAAAGFGGIFLKIARIWPESVPNSSTALNPTH
jgi:hypothetical protein